MGRFRRFRKSSSSSVHHFEGQHRFEHWHLDNQMYLITARCRDRYPAFETEQAKLIFWERFDHYTAQYVRVNVELERTVKRARELKAFLEDVPYKRYER